jgi:hypothetical protein
MNITDVIQVVIALGFAVYVTRVLVVSLRDPKNEKWKKIKEWLKNIHDLLP